MVQHSLTSFKQLVLFFGSVEQAVHPKNLRQWQTLNLHKNHIKRVQKFLDTPSDFDNILLCLKRHCDFICTVEDITYPKQLLAFEDKPPILFGLGNYQLLNEPQIAIVGSRKVSKLGKQLSYDFSYYLSDKGFVITSGLAEGVDGAAHAAALQHKKTIAVIATGIEKTYPSIHTHLKKQILDNNGTIITEFLPFSTPLPHQFPRRNRIISGLSLAVLVTEATLKSGSLGTARHAVTEQGKTVCVIPSHIHDESNKGGHLLIREGAILVDHPEQILEEVALPTQWQVEQPSVPSHLSALYNALDGVGQSIEAISATTNMPIHILNASLLELELLGFCIQHNGLFSKYGKL